MNDATLTYDELAWAAFVASVLKETGPRAYISIYRDTKFRWSLVHEPAKVSLSDIRDKLIAGFLNKWRTRFPNNDESAAAIRNTLAKRASLLEKLDVLRIDDVDFCRTIAIDGSNVLISDAIANIFDGLAWAYGFNTTMAAKVMGVLNPQLCVMWDNSIALHYGASFNGKGYMDFLRKMQILAQSCLSDFAKRCRGANLATHLSQRLGYTPPLTLAKYLDEYNWITITREITLPPKWHPCDDKSRK